MGEGALPFRPCGGSRSDGDRGSSGGAVSGGACAITLPARASTGGGAPAGRAVRHSASGEPADAEPGPPDDSAHNGRGSAFRRDRGGAPFLDGGDVAAYRGRDQQDAGHSGGGE